MSPLYVNIYLIGLGLKEGVVYQMRVSAVTVNGTGPFSSWLQMVVAKSGTGKIEILEKKTQKCWTQKQI